MDCICYFLKKIFSFFFKKKKKTSKVHKQVNQQVNQQVNISGDGHTFNAPLINTVGKETIQKVFNDLIEESGIGNIIKSKDQANELIDILNSYTGMSDLDNKNYSSDIAEALSQLKLGSNEKLISILDKNLYQGKEGVLHQAKLHRLKAIFLYKSDSERCLKELENSIRLDPSDLESLKLIFEVYIRFHDAKNAEIILNKLSKEFPDDKSVEFFRLIGMSKVSNLNSDYKKSLDYCLEAVNYESDLKNSEKAVLFNQVGLAYKNLYRDSTMHNHTLTDEILSYLSLAEKYFKKALEINKQINRQSGVSICLCNLGNIYQDTKDFSRAIVFHTQALLIETDQEKSEVGKAEQLTNIAQTYHCWARSLMTDNKTSSNEIKSKLEQSLVNFMQAKEVYKKQNILYKVAERNLDLAQIYRFLKRRYEVVSVLNEAINFFKKTGNKEMLEHSYYWASNFYLLEFQDEEKEKEYLVLDVELGINSKFTMSVKNILSKKYKLQY